MAVKPNVVLPKRTVPQNAGPANVPSIHTGVVASSPRVLGLDLGFVQTKGVWGTSPEERTKFGSIVKRRSTVATEGVDDAEGYTVKCPDPLDPSQTVTWNVGAKGVYDFTAERLTSDSDLPKLYTALGLYNQQTAHAAVDLLVSGLPVDDFTAYREQFKVSLEGDFHFGFGGRAVGMHSPNAVIIPQSAGAYYDYGLDDCGNIGNSPLLSEHVLSLDFGGRTSDGCIMEKSKYSQESFTIYQGVWKIQNELRKLVAKKYRYTMPPIEADIVLRTGILMLAGTPEDVSELCNLAVETIFPSVRDELSLHISDYRRFAAILLSGGGAYLYEEYIRELAKITTIVLPDAEFANANGYRKYGLLVLGR